MNKFAFNEDDKKQVIAFLNFVAKNAIFKDINTQECIEYYRLLSYMQSSLLPKVEANILEIHKVNEAPQKEEPKSRAKKGE